MHVLVYSEIFIFHVFQNVKLGLKIQQVLGVGNLTSILNKGPIKIFISIVSASYRSFISLINRHKNMCF